MGRSSPDARRGGAPHQVGGKRRGGIDKGLLDEAGLRAALAALDPTAGGGVIDVKEKIAEDADPADKTAQLRALLDQSAMGGMADRTAGVLKDGRAFAEHREAPLKKDEEAPRADSDSD